MYDLLMTGVLRLGAVFLAVYVIQLLFTLIRYLMGAAGEVERMADMVELFEGRLDGLLPLLLQNSGAQVEPLPEHPYVKLAEAVRDASAKLTSK